MNAANSLDFGNLCLDRIAGARRNRNKLHHLTVILGDTIKPKLALISRINDSVVLNGFAFSQALATAESSGKGLDKRLAANGIDGAEVDLDGEWASGLESDPKSLTL